MGEPGTLYLDGNEICRATVLNFSLPRTKYSDIDFLGGNSEHVPIGVSPGQVVFSMPVDKVPMITARAAAFGEKILEFRNKRWKITITVIQNNMVTAFIQ